MDIAVIGHICRDRIIEAGKDQPSAMQYGGIIYSIAALSALSRNVDTIVPVFGVGAKDLDEVRAFLNGLPNVDSSAVYAFKGTTNEVTLIYGGTGTPRIECSTHISDPIPYSRIKPLLDANGVLINMVSGSDITLETLDFIRMQVREARTPIHFDFHSLTLGIDAQDKRFRRPLTDWRRWCFMLHSVQMSEAEAGGLSAERYDEATLINQLMPLMVRSLLITRGERGATIVIQDVHKRLTRTDLPPEPLEAKDTTGCGDVFGAAFLFSTLLGQTEAQAAGRANSLAGFHASLPAEGKAQHLVDQIRSAETTPSGPPE